MSYPVNVRSAKRLFQHEPPNKACIPIDTKDNSCSHYQMDCLTPLNTYQTSRHSVILSNPRLIGHNMKTQLKTTTNIISLPKSTA